MTKKLSKAELVVMLVRDRIRRYPDQHAHEEDVVFFVTHQYPRRAALLLAAYNFGLVPLEAL